MGRSVQWFDKERKNFTIARNHEFKETDSKVSEVTSSVGNPAYKGKGIWIKYNQAKILKNIISYQLGNPVLPGERNNLRTFSLFYDLLDQNLKLIGQVVPELWSNIQTSKQRELSIKCRNTGM